MLQGQHYGYTEVHGGVEAELGSFQGPTEAVGMKHDGDSIDDA